MEATRIRPQPSTDGQHIRPNPRDAPARLSSRGPGGSRPATRERAFVTLTWTERDADSGSDHVRTRAVVWDSSRQNLILRYAPSGGSGRPEGDGVADREASLVLRLQSLEQFTAGLSRHFSSRIRRWAGKQKQSGPAALEVLDQLLRLPERWLACPAAHRPWLGRLVELFLRALESPRWRWLVAPEAVQRARRVALARRLLRWLGPDGPHAAWRIRYDDNLTFARRLRHLERALEWLDDEELQRQTLKATQRSWWLIRSAWQLSCEWCREAGFADAEALAALRRTSLRYLNILLESQRTQQLQEFAGHCGSTLEDEVRQVALTHDQFRTLGRRVGPAGSIRRLFAREEVTPLGDWLANEQESLRRQLIQWFLRRYDVWTAVKLAASSHHPGAELVRPHVFLFLLFVVSCVLFFWHVVWLNNPAAKWTSYLGGDMGRAVLFGVQVVVQTAGLWFFFVKKTAFTETFMPRALMGSLLAWVTVISVSIVGMLAEENAGDAMRAAVSLPEVWVITVGAMPLLSLVLLSLEVTTYIQGFQAIRRTCFVLFVAVLASAYWGLFFSPLCLLLFNASSVSWRTSVQMLAGGSLAAVFFGVLMQLVWEQKFITEPLFDAD